MIDLYFDGACAPKNPGGTTTFGYILKKDGEIIKEGHGVVGKGKNMTNNVGEYHGLIEGIKAFTLMSDDKRLHIHGDSNMVCNMVSKKWGWKKKVYEPHKKFPHLRKLLDEVFTLLEGYDFNVSWVPREENKDADAQSKIPLVELGIVDVSDMKNCTECGGKMMQRKGKFGLFFGCSNYPRCKHTEKLQSS